MRLEAVRIVAEWLKDDTYGYAAKLAALTTDASDAKPTTIADSSIVDETRNSEAAFGRFDGMTLPALIVRIVGDIEWQEQTFATTAQADARFTIRVRYAEKSTVGSTAIADGNYAIRAVVASLRELHKNANAASRTRNNVRLEMCEQMREQGVYEEVDDTWLLAAVDVTYIGRTVVPLGA